MLRFRLTSGSSGGKIPQVLVLFLSRYETDIVIANA
jgi:hypothetical protein